MVRACALFAALTCALPAWAANAIGQVKTLTGQGSIIRQNETAPAEPGSLIYQDDTLVTSQDGSMGVTFIDNATLSLGAKSRLSIDQYVYNVAENDMSFSASVVGGVMALISGDIVKAHPENAVIKTPQATIGIRGTRFVVRVEDSK